MKNKIIVLTLFSISMGLLETAVVVYLRALYYPEGFQFPVITLGTTILTTELFRELATLIMLASIGYMNGENKHQRMAAFMYSFAIWDIFYYVFLKVFLNWPASILAWDLLFLLPVPWIGPVLAPCLISLTMISIYIIMTYRGNQGFQVKLDKTFWRLTLLGFAMILYTFMHDSVQTLIELSKVDSFDLLKDIRSLIPKEFNWPFFLLGESVCVFAVTGLWRQK
ncbi:MAG: hypothetical protein K9H61_01205 [Bacteroidia bacterium]|nr:hypothetical protein [Bacteroidia bacterium]MCF8426793.1 hypothetical protein [Bacteroidia bacterium]MCF8445585.1 hypothetical protein [Bacteroidia bacterium]